MDWTLSTIKGMRRIAAASLLAGLCGIVPAAQAEVSTGAPATTSPLLSAEQRSQVNYGAYILGPGDALQIELLDLPELSGRFSIGPDGTMYLPRLRALYVEGLTVEELRYFLTQQFSTYVRDPQA